MKILLSIIGLVSLGVGLLGIFLPLLPTTPFLLLSATLFAKSSDRLYNWLITHKAFGECIRNFRENKTIPLRVKIISIGMMWTVMLCSIFLVLGGRLWLQAMLFVIAVGVTVHILSYKT
ncbi:MAG: YbaN family protein [Prevotellaceae bacterium]|nr:YbaN family protein [Prevotellaceae bacterium]